MTTAYSLWTTESGGHARTVFAAEGIRCGGCARSIERALSAITGVERAQVNVATSRVAVDWLPALTDLSRILKAVETAGFKPIPLAGGAAEQTFRDERHTALKRIGLAGLGMMQVMMYVFGVYVAEPGSIDPAIASYLQYVGMLITTPVLLYSGAPFYQGAWRSLRKRTLGMDVPVSLALALAFGASVFNTLRGSGDTWFDSVTMFIFFLSAGRYVEMMVRQRRLSASEALARSVPSTVIRWRSDGTTERIPVQDITAGDRLRIPKGAVIPVDAALEEGMAYIDESLITGESTSVRRGPQDTLPGGSVNSGEPITVIAGGNMADSTLASIVSLLERAQSTRPRLTLAADRVASGFVAAILVLAALVALGWLMIEPAHAFEAALAVLVVTCPCALSLATPVAVAAATARLARLGLLVTRPDALERLARIDSVVFDKTGTLTTGAMRIAEVTTSNAINARQALAIAAALERSSNHPIALTFASHDDPSLNVHDVAEVVGAGITGRIVDKTWRIGRYEFVAELAASDPLPEHSRDGLYLGNARGFAAAFTLEEALRPEARAALDEIRSLGLTLVVASGDRVSSVMQAARALSIERASGRLDPAQKIHLVRQLQSEGKRVLMIGDGVNDGPVLAAADVSCAMGQGSAIAQAASDLLLLNDSLGAVAEAVSTARHMLAVIRQNLRWSLLYNFSAVPLAALDMVPPWLAAIGMSLSSLVVVLNAGRLVRAEKQPRNRGASLVADTRREVTA